METTEPHMNHSKKIEAWSFNPGRGYQVRALTYCHTKCRYLNLFLHTQAFHYETLKTALAQLRQGDWMWTLDFKSGYYMIPIAEELQKFLGFCLEGIHFVLTCGPFGLAPLPHLYTQVSSGLRNGFSTVCLRVGSTSLNSHVSA